MCVCISRVEYCLYHATATDITPSDLLDGDKILTIYLFFPGLVTKTKAVAVVLSQDLMLDCDVKYGASVTTSSPQSSSSSSSSSPPSGQFHYQWLFNGSDIGTSLPKGLLFQNHSLFVPRVSEADLGSYQCIAWPTNSSGTTYRSDPIHIIETCKYYI